MEDFIKNEILALSSYGKTAEGGNNRLFGSAAYREAAWELRKRFLKLGMKSWIDSVGNIHGLYPADASMDEPSVLIGSHLDSVKNGGMFDGLLGVVGGMVCVKRLKEEQRNVRCAVHVLAANGEEGNDLGGTFGSRCLAGKLDVSDPSVRAKLRKYAITPEAVQKAKMDFSSVRGYLELHIEQGKTLYESHADVGVVTGIVGLQRYQIRVKGQANHAGTTMMPFRKDALVGAAGIIVSADRLARELGQNLVATFNRVAVEPNVLAVITKEVRMVLECRNRSEDLLEEYVQRVKQQSAQKADAEFSLLVKKSPADCSPKFVEAMAESCRDSGVTWQKMTSFATHDGNMMAQKTPVGMIFVPSKNGISHSKEEWTDWEQCEKGTDILYRTLLKISGAC